ncbi:MAG: endo-1,4-beta-xylanase [Bacteroidota bacterium]
MKTIFPLLLLLFTTLLSAQDDYHNNLQTLLQNDYNLPVGNWVFYDNESQIFSASGNYGVSFATYNTTDQPFSIRAEAVRSSAGNNPWDAAWTIGNKQAINDGDAVLGVFYLRSVDGPGKVNFFVEHATTYEKEVFLTLDIDEEWHRYLVRFHSGTNYGVNGLTWGFHLAHQAQTIEFGGFTALNYGNSVTVQELPNETNVEFYDGWEADAPWRAAAATRIEQLRKTDFNLTVENTSGEAVANAAVELKMLRHEFAFGSAIKASLLPGNNDFNPIYVDKLTNLDGEGHGYNWVVFENDLKWPAWEDEWFVNKMELVQGIEWLRERNIDIRGHNLVWPGNDNLPGDLYNELDNVPYLQQRINEHLESILTYPGVGENIAEWDVLNEIVTNRTLENSFAGTPGYVTGRELYTDIFEKARELDPNAGLWLNDYVTITLGSEAGSGQYEQLKQFLGEIVDSGVDIEGIGFQGHIGGAPNGIPSVLATFDDFYNTYGLKAKITEFDIASTVTEELGATYMADFLTATFSHPSMDGFLFWNFWDGATWLNTGCNFYRSDWSERPSLAAYNDLVFNEWWSNEELATNAAGEAAVRVFKGTYEVVYTCDGQVVRDTVSLTEALNYAISCDNITTNLTELDERQGLRLYPNPSSGPVHLDNPKSLALQLRLSGAEGRQLWQAESTNTRISLPQDLPHGTYLLEVQSEQERWVTQFIRQ